MSKAVFVTGIVTIKTIKEIQNPKPEVVDSNQALITTVCNERICSYLKI